MLHRLLRKLRRDVTGNAQLSADRLAREAARRLERGWTPAQVAAWVRHPSNRARYGLHVSYCVEVLIGRTAA
jgi:hypothetical protein